MFLLQLKGWYSNDDVVAEWKEVKGNMYLDIHCYVSGPNLLLDLAAEFRYHIFSKEMPLVSSNFMFAEGLIIVQLHFYRKFSSIDLNGILIFGGHLVKVLFRK